jgi:hypothetical protein
MMPSKEGSVDDEIIGMASREFSIEQGRENEKQILNMFLIETE